jgi:GDPmannose 4,6-dehydratase
MTVNYLERYDIFSTQGVLFNHESSFRVLKLLTRKNTDSLDTIKQGKPDVLELGNMAMISAIGGFAKKIGEYLSPILQADKASTFVLATNPKRHTILYHLTFKTIGVEFEFKYQGNVKYAVIGGSSLNLLEKDVALKKSGANFVQG